MKKRSTSAVMLKLITLVKPLSGVMCVAVFMGCLGFFCASLLSVLGAYALVAVLNDTNNLQNIFILIAVFAIMRGILHYIEQYCNHFIAFKLLALIRDKVFSALRKLAPAKLDGAQKGNLLSIITADIELLEVFYAHTVSPICIAFITSAVVVGYIATFHPILGVVALLSHLTVGVILPVYLSKQSKSIGEIHREKTGDLNSYFLDSLRGLKEILQYSYAKTRKQNIDALSLNMESANKNIKMQMGKARALTSFCIMFFSLLLLFIAAYMYLDGALTKEQVLIPVVMLFSSFGAVSALANLGAGLTQTIASGNRVLDILEDEPIINEVQNGTDISFNGAELEKISFAYEQNQIFDDFSLKIEQNQILGICGKSGCGKSTMLKLLMRFWDVQKGSVNISGLNVKNINTKSLRSEQALVSQKTYLFHDSILNNLKIAKLDASIEQVQAACKKASVHDFIMTLPNGYETEVGELGGTLSSGEKQRIGLARAFLHDAPFILLDEPTSNLDSLHEGVILKSLQNSKDKTVVLVSHRASTMNIAQKVYKMESGRLS